jgi:8-oxo-dGTP pyrophosphatase MutT (NUDIX family)
MARRAVHLSFTLIRGIFACCSGTFFRMQEALALFPLSKLVRAAGGIVWRQGQNGVEVALVHRPAYDDWTFPKGKLAQGEEEDEGALREVEEETGLRCTLEQFIGKTRYQDRRGRDKVVAYWTMRPTGGTFSPTKEVDELRWVSEDEAASVLTYERDRLLLRRVHLST